MLIWWFSVTDCGIQMTYSNNIRISTKFSYFILLGSILITEEMVSLNNLWPKDLRFVLIQVNLCQKLSFWQNMGRTCWVQKLFWMSETIFVHNMFSPCSAKRRASDKDLPVCLIRFFLYFRIFLICSQICLLPSFIYFFFSFFLSLRVQIGCFQIVQMTQ